MKPCRKYKEQIALAIVEGELTDDLKEHVAKCAACRAYAEETREVCNEHSQRASALPTSEAPIRLHGRVREAIAGHETTLCCGIEIRASLRRLLQGLGVAAAATIIVAVWMHRSPRPAVLPPEKTEITKSDRNEVTELSEPTFAAYHRRLSRSVEELEASLQAAPVANGAEVLKVSSAIDNLP